MNSDYRTRDYEHESESGMGDVALLLGWTPPPDDDGFWFKEPHGPVHDGDLREFVIEDLLLLLRRHGRLKDLARAFRSEVEALRDVRRIVIRDNANLFGSVQCAEVRIAELRRSVQVAALAIGKLTDERDQLFAALKALNAQANFVLVGTVNP